MNTHSDFPTRLRKLRHEAGLSQEKFAKKLFLSRGLYNGLETGREKPSEWVVQQVNMLEKLGAGMVHELEAPPAAMGAQDAIRRELREAFEQLIAAAGDDRDRLGWIREQVREHLTPPKHWRAPDESNADARRAARKHYDEARKATAESAEDTRGTGTR